MQDLRITLLQVNQVWENKQQNEEHFNALLSEISPCDLILLPEMFHTGFSMNTKGLAETMADSKGLETLRQWSQKNKSALYTSLIIEEKGSFYNRGVFVIPSGEIEVYDKQKLFGLGGEVKDFTPGISSKIVTYLGWNIKLQICYDLRFPELARNKIVDGKPAYDVLLYVANWPKSRIGHWDTLLKARAIENQCYVVAVNRVGADGNGLFYNGHSSIYHPSGEQLMSFNEGQEAHKSKAINYQELMDLRKALPFLEDC